MQRTISDLETQHTELQKDVVSLRQENGLLRVSGEVDRTVLPSDSCSCSCSCSLSRCSKDLFDSADQLPQEMVQIKYGLDMKKPQ